MNTYDLGLKIVQARYKADLTQREFAKKVGVSRSAVQCWESGTHPPNFKNRNKIKEVINLDIDALIGDYDGNI